MFYTNQSKAIQAYDPKHVERVLSRVSFNYGKTYYCTLIKYKIMNSLYRSVS